MEWIEAKVLFKSQADEQALDLIANCFHEVGLQGVVIEDPRMTPAEGWGRDAVGPPSTASVAGFFADNGQLATRCQSLEAAVDRLRRESGIDGEVVYRRVDEEDWAESWKAFFHPQRISSRIVVKPTWRTYPARPGDVVLEVDPGMAFGTGTHPTTAMCVRLIETYVESGQAVLDVGTGSGLLLIAALKLGAGWGRGIDNDEVAVTVAAKNLRRNEIPTDRFELAVGDLVAQETRRFDLVLANILSEVILRLLEDLPRVMAAGGIFICSGIVEANQAAVLEKLRATGYEVLQVLTQEEWVAIACRLQGASGGNGAD